MPAVWTEDPTIGNALAGVANAAYMGPMTQLHATEIMQGIRQRNLEYQKLQEQLALSRQAGSLGSDIFNSPTAGTQPSSSQDVTQSTTSPTSASTGIGNTGNGQSSPSPSLPPVGQDVGTPASQRVGSSGNIDFRRNMATYYAAAIRLNMLNGNTAEAERLRQFASSLLHSDYGATSPQEMLVYHNAYSDPKGQEAMGLAGTLERKLAGTGQIMPYETQFMGRYADVNAPLTATSDGRFVRGGLPITPAMMAHLSRNGINLGGFPALTQGQEGQGGQGAPAPGAAPPAGPQAPASAAGPQWNLAGTPAAQAAQEDAIRENITKTDPAFMHAQVSNQNATHGIYELAVPNEDPGAPAAHRAGMALYIKSMLDNARVTGQGQEQIDDLTSKLEQARAYWEKLFTSGGTLPPEIRASMARQMANNAQIASGSYARNWAEGSDAGRNLQARGLSRRAIPAAPTIDPESLRWATVPEAGQPAPGPQRAPGPAQAPGTMQDDLEKRFLGGR
jgi:hypothetical protein